MANFLLLLARRIAAILKAYFARVSADGGAVVDRGHTEVVYNDVQALNPLLIQTCDGGSADDLYSLFAFDDIDDLQLRVVADGGTNVDVGQNAKVAQHLWRNDLHNNASIVVTCASIKAGKLYGYQPTVEPNTTLLDYYTGSAAAYSLRSLSTSTTNVVKVRRSGDDAELDFTASEVSNGTLEAWVVAGGGTEDGFVTTWYDQSGNANNATQATAANQPKIVSSGTLVTENGKAAVDFDGSDALATSGYIVQLSANDATVFAVRSVTAVSDGDYLLTEGDVVSPYSSNFILGGPNGLDVLWVNATTFGSIAVAQQDLLAFTYDGTNFQAYLNGAIAGSAVTATVNSEVFDRTVIGASADVSIFFTGKIQEIITYKSDQSANRTGIEANINAHYNIYP